MDTHFSPVEPRLLCPEDQGHTKGGAATRSRVKAAENDQNRLKISEVFESSQGEGSLAGTPSVFVRLTGCNLRCWFCDTPYASWHPEGEWYGVQELLRLVHKTQRQHVVITGGEPLLQPALVPFTRLLANSQVHVTIETAGTLYQPLDCDLISISPKLPGSAPEANSKNAKWIALHEARRWRPDIIQQLVHDARQWQLKFVIDQPADCEPLLSHVEILQSKLSEIREHVWIMPQARSVEELELKQVWLKPWCASQGFHYCERWQLHWYGNRRGT